MWRYLLDRGALAATGFTVRGLRRTPAFARLHVESPEGGAVVVYLVADPVPRVEAPDLVSIGGAEIEIDSKGEIFANKLNALLSRSELRDLMPEATATRLTRFREALCTESVWLSAPG